MAVISLAVKYRPKTWSDLTEQKSIRDILENQIETKTFQHAYLFTGPAGTGKTTSARIFANKINDNKGHTIEIDAASNSGVDNIRQVIEDSKKKSLDSEYKVFLIDECHSLSSGAWQAMLKLLEEPPKYSIFILCTTNPEKIPQTILSRVQRFQFNKISTQGIVERLLYILSQENIDNYDLSAVQYIAKMANGGMRNSITSLDKCLSLSNNLTMQTVLDTLGVEDYTTYFKLLKKLVSRNAESILDIETVFDTGKDLKQFMRDFTAFILDCTKYSMYQDMRYVNIPETDENIEMLNSFTENDLFPLNKVMLDLLDTIKYDSEPKTIIELTLLSYCKE